MLVAGLVLLAGCNGLAGSPTPTTAVTPAPVPSTPPYPPGLTAEGVVDASPLATAHAQAVSNRSYTLRSNRTVRYANGSLRSRLTVSVELADNRTYLARASTAGEHAPTFLGRPPARATFWSNGSLYLRAYTKDDETTYNQFVPSDRFIASWQYWVSTAAYGGVGNYARRTYELAFESLDTRVAGEVSAGNATLFRVVGRPEGDTGFLPGNVRRIRNLTVVALVESSGLVRSFRVRYTGVQNGEPVRVRWTVTYSDVGSTTVPRPPWFERAVADGETSAAVSSSRERSRNSQRGTGSRGARTPVR